MKSAAVDTTFGRIGPLMDRSCSTSLVMVPVP
jgi:hypothetical protein